MKKKLVILCRETMGGGKGRRLCTFSPNARLKTQVIRSHGSAPQSKEEHDSEIIFKLSVLIQCMRSLIVILIADIIYNIRYN